MKNENQDILAMVYAAKEDSFAADDLIAQYLPFIKAQTAKFTRRIPVEGRDDELSIAMFAFHEAAMAYEERRGNFLAFAASVIKNRLIDFVRKEERHRHQISLDEPSSDGDERTLLDKVDSGRDEIQVGIERRDAKAEILHFTKELGAYGLSLNDIADNCPKQARTLAACHRALAYAKANPGLLAQLEATKRLPISALAKGAGVSKKTLERHRRYLLAILLAYTNGFDLIRAHLAEVAPVKGGQAL